MPWSPEGDIFDIPAPTGWWAEVILQLAPASAALTAIGGTPRVVVSQVLTPDPVGLIVTGGQPSIDVTQHRHITPTGAELTIIGSHPALEETYRPIAGALVISGGQPVIEISDHQAIQPAGAALSADGGTPTVHVTEHVLLAPTALPLDIAGAEPVVTVSDHQGATPEDATLAIIGGQPGVSVGTIIVPAPAGLAITEGAPIVLTPVLVTPSPAGLTIIGSHPALDTTLRPVAAELAVAMGGPAVAVSDHQVFTPAGPSLAIAGGAPTVIATDHQRVTPGAPTLAMAGGVAGVAATAHQVASPTGLPLAVAGGVPAVSVEPVPGVDHSSTGAGNSAQGGSGSGSVSTSWTQSVAAGDTAVLVGVYVGGPRANSNAASATCGGQAMTKLVQVTWGSGNVTAIFGLLDPPTGNQTVSVTGTWNSQVLQNGNTVVASSASYENVGNFGATQSASGSGSQPSVTIASAANRMAFSMIATNSLVAYSSVNQTHRWDNGGRHVIQDAAGASSINFGVTYPSTFGLGWGATAVDLVV